MEEDRVMAIAERIEAPPVPAPRRMTFQEFLDLPEDGFKHEWVDGEAVFVPTRWTHDGIIARLIALLFPLGNALGAFSCGQAGCSMYNGNLRVPDLGFMLAENLPGGTAPNDFAERGPDFCMELVSPSERRAGLERKRHDYMSSGTRILWFADPERGTVTVHTPVAAPRVLRGDDVLDLDGVIPDFRCTVAALLGDTE
jgi:Uma2 family endonuclease